MGEQKKDAERLRHQFEGAAYSASMQVAQQEWEDDQAHVAVDLLNDVSPHLRSWEWHYLQRKFASKETVVGRHSAGVASFALSRDGSRVRVLGYDGCIHDWDIASRRPIGTPLPIAPPGQFTSIINRDSSRVAFTASSGTLWEVWDTETPRLLCRIRTTLGNVAAISPGGEHFATGDFDGVVHLFELPSGRPVARWRDANETDVGPGGKTFPLVRSLDFSASGERLVIGGRDRVHVWDVRTPRRIWSGSGYRDSRSDELHGLTMTAFVGGESNLVLSGGYFDQRVPERSELLMHDLKQPKGSIPRVILSDFRRYTPLAVSPDGRPIAVSDGSRRTLILDGETGRELHRIHPVDPILKMQFTQDSRRLISIDSTGVIRKWELSTDPAGEIIRQRWNSRVFGMVPVDGGRHVIFTAYSEDEKDESYQLAIWDRDAQTTVGLLRLNYRGLAPGDVAASADDSRIAVGIGNGVVQVWDWRKRKLIATMPGRPGNDGVGRVAFLPDGRIVAGVRNGAVRIWNPDRPDEPKELFNRKAVLMSMAVSPNGRMIAVGGDTGTVDILRVDSGEVAHRLDLGANHANSLAFSRDGRRLAIGVMRTAPTQFGVQIWNWESGRQVVAADAAHTSTIPFVAFSPDDKRVITGSLDETIRVWDAELGTKHLTLRGHTSAINRGTLLPNGLLFTSSWDGTVRVWNGIDVK